MADPQPTEESPASSQMQTENIGSMSGALAGVFGSSFLEDESSSRPNSGSQEPHSGPNDADPWRMDVSKFADQRKTITEFFEEVARGMEESQADYFFSTDSIMNSVAEIQYKRYNAVEPAGISIRPSYFETTAARVNAAAARDYEKVIFAASATLDKHLGSTLPALTEKHSKPREILAETILKNPPVKKAPSAAGAGAGADKNNEEKLGLLKKKTEMNGTKGSQKAMSKMGVLQQREESKKLAQLEAPLNYLTNPRNPRATVTFKQGTVSSSQMTVKPLSSVMRVSPPECIFRNYDLGDHLECVFELRNVSPVAHRVTIVPPATDSFLLSRGRFPDQSGLVAPGMSCSFILTFKPQSLEPMFDSMTLCIDGDRYVYDVSAVRNPPDLDIPSIIQFSPCFVGQSSAYTTTVTNRGSRGRFSLQCSDPSFSVYPSEFELFPQDTIDLQFMFSASSEATLAETLFVESDNAQRLEYGLAARGCFSFLDIVRVGTATAPSIQDIQRMPLIFPKVHVQSLATQTVSVQNNRPVAMSYHWDILRVGEKTSEDFSEYSIYPPSGSVAPFEIREFTIKYSPETQGRSAASFVLSVDNVPLPLGENNPLLPFARSANRFFEASTQQDLDPLSFFAPSNLIADPCVDSFSSGCLSTSIPIYRIDARGEAEDCPFFVEPVAFIFAGNLSVGKSYRRFSVLRNDSDVDIDYEWSIMHDPLRMKVVVSHLQGTVIAGSTARVHFDVTPLRSGKFEFEAVCAPQLAASTSILFSGTASGCFASIAEPCVDFGVVDIGSTVTAPLTITNHSDVPTHFLLNIMSESILQTIEKQEDYDEAFEIFVNEPLTRSDADVIFIPHAGVIKPRSSQIVSVFFRPSEAGVLKDEIGAFFKNRSAPITLSVHGVSEGPRALLSQTVFDLGVMHENVPASVVTEIENPGGVYAPFKWEPIESEEFVVICTPDAGILPPTGTMPIEITCIPRLKGAFDFVVPCIVDGMSKLLGIALSGVVKGLLVSISVVGKTGNDESRVSLIGDKDSADDERVDLLLDYGSSAALGCVHQRSIMIQNRSACRSRYNMYLRRYAVAQAALPMSAALLSGTKRKDTVALAGVSWAEELERVQENLPSRPSSIHGGSLSSSLQGSFRRGKEKEATKTKLLLSNAHEEDAKFKSNLGKSMLKSRQAASEENAWKQQMSNAQNGISFMIPNSGGRLEAWDSAKVDVVCVADIPGLYEDTLVVEIHGLDAVEIPISIGVCGCPLKALPKTQGLSIPDSPGMHPVLNFRPLAGASGSSKQTLRIQNDSPLVYSATFYAVESDEPSVSDEIKISIVSDGTESAGVLFSRRRPTEAHECFELEVPGQQPRGRSVQCVFQPGEVKHISVHYNTSSLGNTARGVSGRLLGIVSSLGNGHSGILQSTLRVEDFHMHLVAGKIQETIECSVDRIQMHVGVSQQNQTADASQKFFCVSNALTVPVSFSVKVTQDQRRMFELRTVKNHHASSSFTLNPRESLDLHVGFSAPYYDPAVFDENPKSFSASIEFTSSDGTVKTVPVSAIVHLPRVSIQPEAIQFGKVNRAVTLPFIVSNESRATASWFIEPDTSSSANHDRFTFSTTHSVLAARESFLHQEKVNVTFHPRQGSFHSVFNIVCENGGPTIQLSLAGQGEFSEFGDQQ
eukprot:ANDGO_01955.mRNA.1 hypothetical protein (macronuclear)